MQSIKGSIYQTLRTIPFTKNIMHGVVLYPAYACEFKESRRDYIKNNYYRFEVINSNKDKYFQIQELLNQVDIEPVENDSFFYCIDCFKTIERKGRILENFTVDYSKIICNGLNQLHKEYTKTDLYKQNSVLVNAIKTYIGRCKEKWYKGNNKKLDAIESIIDRPAMSFFEGLQRILFFNQLLWQTGHRHNGLGRLDVILYDLFYNDYKNQVLSLSEAKKLISDFFCALHQYYWFKSGMMLGDTGQLIVIGGLEEKNDYNCNELTQLFLDVSYELLLPDPKIFLRCSTSMPDNLLRDAMKCISTGLGAPLLSNDDSVIPAMMSCGYSKSAAYNYVASACWEPLVVEDSNDLNNILSINFAIPFLTLFENDNVDNYSSIESIIVAYKESLKESLDSTIGELQQLEFDIDPLITMLSENAFRTGKDITRGGALYNNLGLTSVGLSSVVDSLLIIDELVFQKKIISLSELNLKRSSNSYKEDTMIKQFTQHAPEYGQDNPEVVSLTKRIVNICDELLSSYHTKHGGIFKFGLSSPYYIEDGERTDATFDGRRSGEPFNVHISARNGVAYTSLISFATQLDYHGRRLNGNVVDFFETKKQLSENMDKYLQLVKTGFRKGLFQMQMNVVDSKTLKEAYDNPERFPHLIVRVWGFSAYFNDLPDEYKRLLIERAEKSERCA